MGWETRTNGSRYYTRTRRVPGGGWEREYWGSGLLGHLAAADDAEERAKRVAERERWRSTVTEFEALDADVAKLSATANDAVAELLESAGYHQHARGAWRRRRHGR